MLSKQATLPPITYGRELLVCNTTLLVRYYIVAIVIRKPVVVAVLHNAILLTRCFSYASINDSLRDCIVIWFCHLSRMECHLVPLCLIVVACPMPSLTREAIGRVLVVSQSIRRATVITWLMCFYFIHNK